MSGVIYVPTFGSRNTSRGEYNEKTTDGGKYSNPEAFPRGAAFDNLTTSWDGRSVIPLDVKSPYGVNFFRKRFNKRGLTKKDIAIEIRIADIVRRNPTDYVVRIYGLGKDDEGYYIDMQLLENISDEPFTKDRPPSELLLDHARRGLENLHKLNIAHNDVHGMQFGWDKNSAQWRIFDFDHSGLMSPDHKQWVIHPGEDPWSYLGFCVTDDPWREARLHYGEWAKNQGDDSELAKICKNETLTINDWVQYWQFKNGFPQGYNASRWSDWTVRHPGS